MAESNADARSAYIDVIPFARHLGFEVVRYEAGDSELRWAPRAEHLNHLGMAHGGACMTMLDIAMAAAARSEALDMAVVTIEMKTTFMRPSRGPLVARGRLLHRTRSMAFVEATIFDGQDHACAHSTGTFKFVPRPVPGGDVASNDQVTERSTAHAPAAPPVAPPASSTAAAATSGRD
ncbi:MAG: PaaI family thioesterase [Comamonadaceae bacterium]|nr:MAG: PaaI family thioesterase [Comamonadaceae bacterium]